MSDAGDSQVHRITVLHRCPDPLQSAMAEAFEKRRAHADLHELSFSGRLARLFEAERLARDDRRRARLLKAAALRLNA